MLYSIKHTYISLYVCICECVFTCTCTYVFIYLFRVNPEGGSGYLPGKKLPMRGVVPAAERRGRLSQGRNAVVRRDDRPWSAGTIGRGAQGRNAVVRRARMPQGKVTI